MKIIKFRNLYLFYYMMMTALCVTGQQSITEQAYHLIQTSYASQAAKNLVQKFMNQHNYYESTDLTKIPSVAEILSTISQLQDPYGCIADKTLQEIVLDVLRATITATNNALEKIKNNRNDQSLSTTDAQIIESIQYQNKLLRIQFTKIKHRSLQSYLMAPSTWYMIGTVIALISLSSFLYYYNFPVQNEEYNFILTPEEEHQVEQNIGHKRARNILAEIALSKTKINPQDYLQSAHEIIPQLDPKLDKNLKHLIQTFINIQEGGFLAKIEARKDQDQLKQTYAHTLNSDPEIRKQAPDGIIWQPQDINVMRLVK